MAENFTEGDLAFHSLAVDGIRARCCETRRLCTRNHARVGSPFEPSDGGLELNSATVEHKQLVCERNWEALLAARMVGRWQQGGIQGHPLGLCTDDRSTPDPHIVAALRLFKKANAQPLQD